VIVARVFLALALLAAALLSAWGATFGMIVLGWMPDTTAEDAATKFVMLTLMIMLAVASVAFVAAAGAALEKPVRMLFDRIQG
jgi:hypothetical protein